MEQVASSVGRLEAQINGKLASQAFNKKENVSAIILFKCTTKRAFKLECYETISMGEVVSTIVLSLSKKI